MALAGGQYLEVVEVLDHPASDKAPFGQAVRARSEQGGGWLGWVIAVDDLGPAQERLGRPPVEGNRHLPSGQELKWLQLGVKGMQADAQLPFFVKWLSDAALHPSAGGSDIELLKIDIAGDPERVDDWLGGAADRVLHDVEINWIAPNGQPGLVAVTFGTPHGDVRL